MSKPRKKARRSPRSRSGATPVGATSGTRAALRWGLAVVALIVAATVALVLAQPGRSGRAELPVPPPPSAPHLPGAPSLETTVPEALTVEVLHRYPHARSAFTQGLLVDDGVVYESTGLRGRSSLREVDLRSGEVRRQRAVDDAYFAEGLALVGDRLIQLTWQSGRAFIYRKDDFAPVGEYRYPGEGWGLCYDGEYLVMSDGSSELTFRDPESFVVRRRVEVTQIGRPLRNLNELECVDGQVYANVWQTDEIVRIDPTTGVVTAVVDASGLLSLPDRAVSDVLNGIAYVPERQTFLVTGKLWPTLFEVRFVPR